MLLCKEATQDETMYFFNQTAVVGILWKNDMQHVGENT